MALLSETTCWLFIRGRGGGKGAILLSPSFPNTQHCSPNPATASQIPPPPQPPKDCRVSRSPFCHSISRPGRALRAVDQKSDRLRNQIQKNFPAKPSAFPTLIKIRCASVLTKAHHSASLTGGQHDEARCHGVTKTQSRTSAAARISLSLALFSVSSVSSVAPRFPPPPRTKAHHPHANLAKRSHRPAPTWRPWRLGVRLPAPAREFRKTKST